MLLPRRRVGQRLRRAGANAKAPCRSRVNSSGPSDQWSVCESPDQWRHSPASLRRPACTGRSCLPGPDVDRAAGAHERRHEDVELLAERHPLLVGREPRLGDVHALHVRALVGAVEVDAEQRAVVLVAAVRRRSGRRGRSRRRTAAPARAASPASTARRRPAPGRCRGRATRRSSTGSRPGRAVDDRRCRRARTPARRSGPASGVTTRPRRRRGHHAHVPSVVVPGRVDDRLAVARQRRIELPVVVLRREPPRRAVRQAAAPTGGRAPSTRPVALRRHLTQRSILA